MPVNENMGPKTRRVVIRRFGVGIAVTTVGCVGLNDENNDGQGQTEKTDHITWPPEITTNEPELTPSGAGILTVEVTGGVSISIRGGQKINFEYERANISPPPDRTYRTRPPDWVWDAPTTVSIDLPVFTDEDVKTGKYNYEVEVSSAASTNEGQAVSEEFSISVVAD